MEKSIPLPEPLGSLLNSLEAESLTNFYGAPGTGKTNICLLVALECAKDGGSVLFIDTEGGFSVERIKQLENDYEKILRNIKIIEPKDFREQGKIIRELSNQKPDLVILDSAVALYRLEYAEQKKEPLEANRELSKQFSILSSLAREKKIPVIVTAHIFKNWDTGRNEVVGGDSIKYWSKVMVHIEKTGKTSERRATITKHRHLPEMNSVKFVLDGEGIKPSGFKLF